MVQGLIHLTTLLILGLISIGLTTSCGPTQNIDSESLGAQNETFKFQLQSLYNDISDFNDSSAWLLGEEKIIKYCLDVHSSFSISEPNLEEMVANNLIKWSKYIRENNVNHLGRPNELRLATTFHLDRDCTQADLRFVFGGELSHEGQYNHSFETPIGVAIREQFDYSTGWGRGFIWISSENTFYHDLYGLAPNWQQQPYSLEATLLHEIGHIFGLGHFHGTIMQPNAHSFLKPQRSVSALPPVSIDTIRALYNGPQAPLFREGWSPRDLGKIRASVFEKLTGRQPAGETNSRISFENKSIHLVDDSTSLELQWETYHESNFVLSHNQLFKARRLNANSQLVAYSEDSIATVQLANIKEANGSLLPIIIEYNSNHFRPLVIKALDWDNNYRSAFNLVNCNPMFFSCPWMD